LRPRPLAIGVAYGLLGLVEDDEWPVLWVPATTTIGRTPTGDRKRASVANLDQLSSSCRKVEVDRMRRREFIALLGGGTIAWPSFALSQKVRRIAIVHPDISVDKLTDLTTNPNFAAFVAELRQLGYAEGSNLVIDRYSAEGVPERFAVVARDAVRGSPDAIVTVGRSMAQIFKEATKSIAIVVLTADPIALGLTASLSRPGGNLTGVVSDAGLEVWQKRFELLHEVVPTASTVAFPFTRDGWERSYAHGVREAATKVGMSLRLAALDIPTDEGAFRRGFAAIRDEHVDALAIADVPLTFAHQNLIVKLVEELRLPAVYPFRQFVVAGGLMAYSVDLPSLWRQIARQVDQILKGTKPGDIPFYQAERFVEVINLKTVMALGLTIPPTLLVRADEVIE
jgi:putative ABC transport system substrate-binding protein